MKKYLVIGIGNVLMGDDAFGPHVAQLLTARLEPHADVEIEEVGTPGLDLMMHLSGRDAIVVVDTVNAEGEPGTLRLYSREELLTVPAARVLTPHDPGLREALLTLEMTDELAPELTLVGVIPEFVDTPVGLRAPVKAAIEPAIETILTKLREQGLELTEREKPQAPDLWWE